MIPLGRPGAMTEMERFQFDTAGYLVIPGALSPEETKACLEAAQRLHAAHPPGQWRQLGVGLVAVPSRGRTRRLYRRMGDRRCPEGLDCRRIAPSVM